MKIAVVHDNFAQLGGAERVVEEIYGMFPQASLFAAVALRECMPSGLQDVPVHTSWMQNLPRIKEYFRLYFLLYPLAMGALRLSEYDLVLSSCFAYAKGVQARRDAIRKCPRRVACRRRRNLRPPHTEIAGAGATETVSGCA